MSNIINTVFYTFSTIAQTLAGAIALLGAFVLYRLQSLSSDIERDSHTVELNHTVERDKIRELRIQKKYQEIVELSKSTLRAPSPQEMPHPDLKTSTDRLRRNLDLKDALLKTSTVVFCHFWCQCDTLRP